MVAMGERGWGGGGCYGEERDEVVVMGKRM